MRALGWVMAIGSPVAAATIAIMRTIYMDQEAFYLTILWMVGCMFAGVGLLTEVRR